MDLTGKVAFITGSSRGIGKGFAEALLQKGAKVFLNDVDEAQGTATLAELVTTYGADNVRFMKLDVTNEGQFEEVFAAAISAFGQVDIMVNNAGVFDESKWQLMIQVNMLGVVKGTKLAEQHMRKDKGGKGGRIVNISSAAGTQNSCLAPVYVGTKHAVRSFTTSQATQYDRKDQEIEYAVLCPHIVDTEMIRQADTTRVYYYDDTTKALLKNALPVSQVVDACMTLVELEQMNGAILQVSKEGKTFQKMTAVDLGPDYVSSVE